MFVILVWNVIIVFVKYFKNGDWGGNWFKSDYKIIKRLVMIYILYV